MTDLKVKSATVVILYFVLFILNFEPDYGTFCLDSSGLWTKIDRSSDGKHSRQEKARDRELDFGMVAKETHGLTI